MKLTAARSVGKKKININCFVFRIANLSKIAPSLKNIFFQQRFESRRQIGIKIVNVCKKIMI